MPRKLTPKQEAAILREADARDAEERRAAELARKRSEKGDQEWYANFSYGFRAKAAPDLRPLPEVKT